MLAVPLALTLGSCARELSAPSPRFTLAEHTPTMERGMALVMPADALGASPYSASEYSYESVRRDGALAGGMWTSPLSTPSYYRTDDPPLLGRSRRVYFPRDPGTTTFFLRESDSDRSFPHSWNTWSW